MRNITERPSNLQGMLTDLVYWGYTENLLRETTHLCSEQINSIFNGNNNLELYSYVLPAWCDAFVRHQEELSKQRKKEQQQKINEEERGWPDMNVWDADDAVEV